MKIRYLILAMLILYCTGCDTRAFSSGLWAQEEPVPGSKEEPNITISPPKEACTSNFCYGVPKFPAYPKPGFKTCDPPAEAVKRKGCTTINYIYAPGSVWERDGDARRELSRAQAWFAKYCIYLTFQHVPVTDQKFRAVFMKHYADFQARYPKQVNTAGMQEFYQKFIIPLYKLGGGGNQTVVMFFDRYVFYSNERVNSQGVFTGRSVESSGTHLALNAIGIHKGDKDDPYIVTHELIHALGKKGGNPGTYSWNHDSSCKNAMSLVARGSISDPLGLTGSHLLDLAEYVDIHNSGRLAKCQ